MSDKLTGIKSRFVRNAPDRQVSTFFVNLAKYQQVIRYLKLKIFLNLRFWLKSKELARNLSLFKMVDSFLSTGTTH